jgi:hypothetical protein
MRHPPQTYANGTSNVVVDEYGSGRHGFTDGSPALWDVTLGVNGDATENTARWFADVTLAIKNTCIEGNGAQGPAGDDVADDPFELTRAVNTAANVLTGEASFVAAGLEFDTTAATFPVELSPGIIAYEGRKYHVTAAHLAAINVLVNGAAAGTGNAFTLIASRDHYVSIGPLADDHADVLAAMGSVFAITVTDVANGASVPGAPAGQFMIGMIATDVSGVIVGGVTRINHGPIISGHDGNGHLRLRYTGLATALEPYDFSSGATLGSRSSVDSIATLGGNFWTNIYTEEIEVRSYDDAGHTSDRTRWFSRRASTAGAVNATMDMLDLDDFPNSSVVEIEVTVLGKSHLNQYYTRTFRQMAARSSAGAMGLYGSLREISVDDPAVLGCTAIFIASAEGDNSLIQVRVTGAAANNIEWTARINDLQSWGS